MAKKSSGSGWDGDDDDPDDFELEPSPAEGWEVFDVSALDWDAWWEFDWDSYDGEYEEYAVSADYEG